MSENTNLESKVVKLKTQPDTGEQTVIGEYNEEFDKSFDDMVNKINEGDDIFAAGKPLSETDVINYMATEDSKLLSELIPGTNFSEDDIKQILQIVNRVIKREDINIYKEMPQSVRSSIDTYVSAIGAVGNVAFVNAVKKDIAKSIVDDFINNIQLTKAKADFATELQQIYETSAKDLANSSLDIIDERNKAYREAADNIEDEEKRDKLKAILDQIDEARNLTLLKEYAKKTKIKSIEIEKPEKKAFAGFTAKYINSTNNIYDINLAKKMLARNLNSTLDADLFLILFCKQVKLYCVDNPLHHAYMYYVLYYCAMLDSDKSDTFKNNIREVINNIKVRNNIH